MKPLYSKSSKCFKCGSDDISTEKKWYIDTGDDFMKRTCRNCSHHWQERPLDQATPEEWIELSKHEGKY